MRNLVSGRIPPSLIRWGGIPLDRRALPEGLAGAGDRGRARTNAASHECRR